MQVGCLTSDCACVNKLSLFCPLFDTILTNLIAKKKGWYKFYPFFSNLIDEHYLFFLPKELLNQAFFTGM